MTNVPIGPLDMVRNVTPDDGADLPDGIAQAIYVGTAGNVTIQDATGTQVTISDLAAGVWHPIRTLRVYATGTTATEIVAGY